MVHDETDMSKMLLSSPYEVHRDGKKIDNAIDLRHLMFTALLYCNPSDKSASTLYKVVTSTDDQFIAHDNEHIASWFAEMCLIATSEVIAFVDKEKELTKKYSEDDHEAMKKVAEDTHGLLEEWKNAVFGSEQFLSDQSFAKEVVKNGEWIYQRQILREKVLARANLNNRFR